MPKQSRRSRACGGARGAQRAPPASPVLSITPLENCGGRICRRRHTPHQHQPPHPSGRSGAWAYGAPQALPERAAEPRAFCSARKAVDAHAPAHRAGQSCREASATPARIKSRRRIGVCRSKAAGLLQRRPARVRHARRHRAFAEARRLQHFHLFIRRPARRAERPLFAPARPPA